jgi:hypothetical protein
MEMNEPFRIRTFAAFAILFLLLVFGARRIGRELAAPFEGLERFARWGGSPAAPEESEFSEAIRAIDWDAPVVLTPSVPKTKSARKLEVAPVAEVLQDLATDSLVRMISLSLVVGLGSEEPDLDTMTASLGLSDDQKARVAGLIEWRKWSIDSLTRINADPESKDRVNELFREAVKGLLDEAQALKYADSSSVLRLGVVLERAGTETESSVAEAVLKQVVEKREEK